MVAKRRDIVLHYTELRLIQRKRRLRLPPHGPIIDMNMATIIYIDGFNFYYGAVKGTPHKWLDYEALCRRLLPRDSIAKIRYFTAPIKPNGTDDSGVQRQHAFLRAVAENPLIEIHRGHFRRDPKWLPIAPGEWSELTRPRVRPSRIVDLVQRMAERKLDRPPSIRVMKTEEKGSDVNLASHLLRDTFKGNCTKALVISNDSDLAGAIGIAVAEGVTVGVVNPHRINETSRHLAKVANFKLQLRHQILGSCQLPNPVITSKGRQIHKPQTW